MQGCDANENIQPERLGVYVGSGCGGINTITEQCSKFWESGPRHVSPFLIPMMIGNIASGNIAIRFHAQGPNLPVVTACATSTHAIGEAFRAIRYGYADAIIAGGAEAAHQRGRCGWLCKLQSADHLRGPGKRLLAL